MGSLERSDLLALISESVSKVVVRLHRCMLSGKQFLKLLWLTTRSLWMKRLRKKSKIFWFSMIVHCWLLIQDAVNLRSLEDQVPEPDIKNHTVNCCISISCIFTDILQQ